MSAVSPDWTLCRSFLTVLRTGSLSHAARKLGVTHPTIRRHIEQLEEGVRSPLFVRSPAGLVPTPLALSMRAAAEAMEAAFEEMIRAASATAESAAGTVRITASEVMGVEVLPPLLAGIRSRHPALSFELDVSDDLANLLRRDADIAIRMTQPLQGELVVRRVAVVPLGLFAHAGWLAARGAPASLQGLLQDRQLIGYDRHPALLDALSVRGIAAERGDFGFRSDSTLAQLAALRAGLGVAVCQLPLAARDPALVRVLPDIQTELDIWVAVHPNLRASRAVRACLDALGDALADYARG